MKAWLNLCRWPNLIMVALAQILFKYVFLPAFDISSVVRPIDFFWLCLSVILVTASGNIINDIHDIKSDFVNRRLRPLVQNRISILKAYIVYFVCNALAILSALFVSLKYDKFLLDIIVITVILLLFLYARILKSIPVLGNVLVSLLVSLSFLLVVYVELSIAKQVTISNEFIYWIIGYGSFAFWANLNREWIKDVMDIKGDYAQGISTLPILLGKSRMNILIFFSTLCLMIALISGVKVYFQLDMVFIIYLTFGVCGPLCFVLYHIYQKELNADYNMLSIVYKVTMLIGLFSLILFKL